MEIRSIDTRQALIEILSVFGIERISNKNRSAIEIILIDLERCAKWKGVRNANNWIAGINPMTLTIDEDYIFNKKHINATRK